MVYTPDYAEADPAPYDVPRLAPLRKGLDRAAAVQRLPVITTSPERVTGAIARGLRLDEPLGMDYNGPAEKEMQRSLGYGSVPYRLAETVARPVAWLGDLASRPITGAIAGLGQLGEEAQRAVAGPGAHPDYSIGTPEQLNAEIQNLIGMRQMEGPGMRAKEPVRTHEGEILPPEAPPYEVPKLGQPGPTIEGESVRAELPGPKPSKEQQRIQEQQQADQKEQQKQAPTLPEDMQPQPEQPWQKGAAAPDPLGIRAAAPAPDPLGIRTQEQQLAGQKEQQKQAPALPDDMQPQPEQQQQAKPAETTRDLVQRVPGLKNVIKHLEPDEVEKVRSRNAQDIHDIFTSLPSSDEMAAVAYSGRAKRGWYRDSAHALVRVFGLDDAPRFAALLAATSPQTTVETNALNAINIWKNWVAAGRPQAEPIQIKRFAEDPDYRQTTIENNPIIRVMGDSVEGGKGVDSVLPAWINNTITALTHEDPMNVVLSGPKVHSFAANLRGHVNAVTLDAWMANYANVSQDLFRKTGESPGKGPGYIAFSAAVRNAAKVISKKTGYTWTPAEIQETIWSWAKILYEKAQAAGTDMTAQQILAAGGLTHEDIAGTPDFGSLFISGAYKRILEEAGYGDQIKSLESPAAGNRGVDPQHGLTGSVTGAEGSGFTEPTFGKHLRRAAKRLDTLAEQRRAEAEAKANAEVTLTPQQQQREAQRQRQAQAPVIEGETQALPEQQQQAGPKPSMHVQTVYNPNPYAKSKWAVYDETGHNKTGEHFDSAEEAKAAMEQLQTNKDYEDLFGPKPPPQQYENVGKTKPTLHVSPPTMTKPDALSAKAYTSSGGEVYYIYNADKTPYKAVVYDHPGPGQQILAKHEPDTVNFPEHPELKHDSSGPPGHAPVTTKLAPSKPMLHAPGEVPPGTPLPKNWQDFQAQAFPPPVEDPHAQFTTTTDGKELQLYPKEHTREYTDKEFPWEWREYDKYGRSAAPDAFANEADFKRKYDAAPLVHLKEGAIKSMEYATAGNYFGVGQAAGKAAFKGHRGEEGVNRIYDQIYGNDVAPPIVLRTEKGLRILGGNTRLSLAAAVHQNLPVKLIDVRNKLHPFPKENMRDYEPDELPREYKEFQDHASSLVPDAFDSFDDFKQKLAAAPLVHLPEKVIAGATWSSAMKFANKGLKNIEGDVVSRKSQERFDRIKGQLENGSMPPPIFLRTDEGYVRLGGNTRMSMGAAEGHNIPVKLIDVRENVPGGAFKPWKNAPTDLKGWAGVSGQNAELAKTEPPLASPKGLALATGVIIQEPDGSVWLMHPKGQFGGYKATFPKGRLEKGLSPQANAIKEAFEETGFKVKITGHLGDFDKTTTRTRYYIGERVGGKATLGPETEGVSKVSLDQLPSIADHPSDVQIVKALKAKQPLMLPKYRPQMGEGLHKRGTHPVDRLLNKYPEHQKAFEPHHIKALQDWSGNVYNSIANHIYDGQPISEYERRVMRGLDDLFAKSKIPTNLTTWRAVDRKVYDELKKLQPGDYQDTKGYQATSLRRKFAEGWKSHYYKIILPRGSHGAVLGHYSHADYDEAEVLLPREQTMVYQGKDKDGIMMFHAVGKPPLYATRHPEKGGEPYLGAKVPTPKPPPQPQPQPATSSKKVPILSDEHIYQATQHIKESGALTNHQIDNLTDEEILNEAESLGWEWPEEPAPAGAPVYTVTGKGPWSVYKQNPNDAVEEFVADFNSKQKAQEHADELNSTAWTKPTPDPDLQDLKDWSNKTGKYAGPQPINPANKDYGNLAEKLAKYPDNITTAKNFLHGKGYDQLAMTKDPVKKINYALKTGWQPQTIQPMSPTFLKAQELAKDPKNVMMALGYQGYTHDEAKVIMAKDPKRNVKSVQGALVSGWEPPSQKIYKVTKVGNAFKVDGPNNYHSGPMKDEAKAEAYAQQLNDETEGKPKASMHPPGQTHHVLDMGQHFSIYKEGAHVMDLPKGSDNLKAHVNMAYSHIKQQGDMTEIHGKEHLPVNEYQKQVLEKAVKLGWAPEKPKSFVQSKASVADILGLTKFNYKQVPSPGKGLLTFVTAGDKSVVQYADDHSWKYWPVTPSKPLEGKGLNALKQLIEQHQASTKPLINDTVKNTIVNKLEGSGFKEVSDQGANDVHYFKSGFGSVFVEPDGKWHLVPAPKANKPKVNDSGWGLHPLLHHLEESK